MCVDGFAGVEHASRFLHSKQAHQVRCCAECATVDFGKRKRCTLRRDHDVGGTRDANATTDAITMHGRDHRDGAIIDVPKRLVAATVHLQDLVAIFRKFFDVDARLKPLAFGANDYAVDIRVLAKLLHAIRELKPRFASERVHGRVVDHHLANAVVDLDVDCHFASASI